MHPLLQEERAIEIEVRVKSLERLQFIGLEPIFEDSQDVMSAKKLVGIVSICL